MKNKEKVKNKLKSKKLRRKPIVLVIFLIVIISFKMTFNFYILYKNGGIKIAKNTDNLEKINFKISKGSSVKKIANDLKEKEIIDDKFLFTLKCKNLGISSDFQYGEFVLSKNMSFEEIIEILKTPNENTNQIKLLIKEGETQEQIARNLEAQGVLSYEEFMKGCNTLNFDYEFLKDIPERESKLEGYLYPDTYFIDKNESAENIINKILKRFDEVYKSEIKNQNSEFTTDQIITIASMIEKEIKYEPEKNIAVSVILNRLKNGIKLQLDATVLYANKEHKERTSINDTKIKSPYNTYYVDGLPLGPISNPGISSIKAVLNPADTDFLYYVLKDSKTGEHFYTKDYNEFLKAKKLYLKNFNK